MDMEIKGSHMFNDYSLLPTENLKKNTHYYKAEKIPDIVNLDSPALLAFIDFHLTQPMSTSKDILASDALDSMQKTKAKGLIVVDSSNYVIGVITISDIVSSRRTIIAQNNDVKICDVTVGMLMKRIRDIIGINFKYINTARVGHIAKLLHDNNLMLYCDCVC